MFPHRALRNYQARFLRFVENNPKVIIHAPVGFGKTVMALISCLPLVKQENYQLFIFVRTKAQVFRVFLNEIYKIANSRKYGYLTAVPLILKSDLCLKINEIPQFYKGICSSIRCPYLEQARSIPEEDLSMIVEQVPITSHENDKITIETFQNAFREFGCPYYVIKRCIPYANIIVTTQTYIRSKNLQPMFSELLNKSTFAAKICIIDEGHNFSADLEAEISLRDIQQATSIIPLKIFDTLQDLIIYQKGRVERPTGLSVTAIDAYLDHEKKITMAEKTQLLKIKDFIQSRGDIWIAEESKIIQLNPFPQSTFDFINPFFQRIILMSGTFQPIISYKLLYGINHYANLSIPADFQFNLNSIMYNRRFTSKFTQRSPKTYENMADVIKRLHESNPSHTIVFTTSHEFKHKLITHLQVSNYYEEMINTPPYFLDELSDKKHELILGVLGGRLSEGIEILNQDNRSLLTLIIIAGLPYPQPNMTNKLLNSLYTRKWGIKMAKHLTTLPLARTISQAIGRGIRSETDFAASVILDYRAIHIRPMLPPTRIFRDLPSLYNAYDLFFAKMRKIFSLDK